MCSKCQFELHINTHTHRYVHAECANARVENDRAVAIDVLKPESSELSTISCGHVVNAAGPHAATVHRMIENKDDLPIRPRKRNVFVLHCTEPSLQNCPMLIDKSGVYVFCSSAYVLASLLYLLSTCNQT